MKKRHRGKTIRKAADGYFYIFINPLRLTGKNNKTNTEGRTDFLVKCGGRVTGGYVNMAHQLYCPNELVGKRIRFKVEVVKE